MTRIITTAAALLALSACSNNADELTAVLPDDRIQVNLPTDLGAQTARADLGQRSEFYIQTAQATEDVNGLIGDVLRMVDDVTDLRPSAYDRRNHTAVWGPFVHDDGLVQTSLTVRYDPETDMHGWWFSQAAAGSDASEDVVVIAGEVDPGATRDESSGRFAIDFTTIAGMDEAADTAGVFTSEYAISPDGVLASAHLADWDNLDDDEDELAEAMYVYEQSIDGVGMMDLVIVGDYLEDGGTNDIYVLRSRWNEMGAGRGDAALADPDQSEEKQLVAAAVQCWDTSANLVFQAVAQGNGYSQEGNNEACVYTESAWDAE